MKKPIYRWDSRHGEIFDSYIRELNNAKIKYFILRNYEGLPDNNESKDVDLIIEPGEYTNAAQLLIKTFKQSAVEFYYVVKYERVRCWLGMNFSDDFAIHIDLIEGYVNKGFEIFDFNRMYENTVLYKDYKVLNQPYDIVMLLLYKVIGAKELKERYCEKISTSYGNCSEDIKNILIDVLGNELAWNICRKLEKNDYTWIVNHAGSISKISKKIAFKKHPIKTIINIVAFLSEKFYRIGICPKKYRKMIAVEAPDGTGKSTFIDAMRVILAEMFVCDIEKMHVYHFRPSLFPNLGAVGEKAGVMKQDKDFENPHRNQPANPISSLMRMGYYWMDYVVGGALCIRKDVQFDKITIFDRYVYDFIIDPHRSRINLPKLLRILLAKLVQQPQVVFILSAPAEVIYSRKQELSLDEIKRQLSGFAELNKLGNNFYTIDANQTPDRMVQNAKMIILNKFCKKLD